MFFPRRELLRAWFEKNHATSHEVWIAYYKQGSGRTSVTYAEAVEEALCFGWIDGQVRALDASSYANRYTPRRAGSRWSAANVSKVEQLRRAGRMHPAGLEAYFARDPTQPAGYSSEDRPQEFDSPLLHEFRSDPRAWGFFQAQAPSYRRVSTFWVMSARREETRLRRLHFLMEHSRLGKRIDLLSPGTRS
jgi:uncharacterized protein YdeI (YjbR/CyaY-like superfamily)